MNILVISYSSIVIELLKLVFKDNNIKSEYTKSTDNAQNDSYDIIFIDDSTPNLIEQIEKIKENFDYFKLILIGKLDNKNLVDIIITKPFLPKDIKDIVDGIKKEKKKANTKTHILDFEEITKIKELMALDDDKKELSTLDKLEQKKSLKLKGKDAREFLYECRGLTKKELKRLLKGAKISIKINFKSKDNE